MDLIFLSKSKGNFRCCLALTEKLTRPDQVLLTTEFSLHHRTAHESVVIQRSGTDAEYDGNRRLNIEVDQILRAAG